MSNESIPAPQEPAENISPNVTEPEASTPADEIVETEAVQRPRYIDAQDLTAEEIAEMEAHSIPAVKRKAPKFSAFFWTGSIVGIILGTILGVRIAGPGQFNPFVIISVIVAFTTMIVLLITAGLVLYLDKRSIQKAEEQKRAIG